MIKFRKILAEIGVNIPSVTPEKIKDLEHKIQRHPKYYNFWLPDEYTSVSDIINKYNLDYSDFQYQLDKLSPKTLQLIYNDLLKLLNSLNS